MDPAKLRHELEDLIEGIQSHLSNTKEFNPIPSLELQLIVSKIEKLHQKAIIFQYLNQNAPVIDSMKVADILKEVEAAPNVQVSHEIRRFIGINDKFLFINQLFQQKADIYESALDRINQCPSIEKAVVLLNQLADELNWTADNELTEAFFAIVRRTFGK